jgi:hypothetical protein
LTLRQLAPLFEVSESAADRMSKNYRHSINHQAVIDADTRLAVGRPATATTARRGSCLVRRPPVGRTTVIADDG